MIEIQNTRINTAGAYVCVNGLYVFSIGIRQHNGNIPVIRLGGHREEHESSWQCTVREVYEESNLQIKPLCPPTTYLYNCDHIEGKLQEIPWQHEPEAVPVLVGTYCREGTTSLSLMYIAHAAEIPTPSSEVKGLLMLREEEVHRRHICHEPMTLKQYLIHGGKALLNGDFDKKCILEPFTQLRLLSRILILHKIRTV